MPDREDFSKLIANLDSFNSNDPDVKAIREDIAEADRAVKELINPTKDGGWKLLNQQDKDNLVQKYESALLKMDAYLKKEKNADDPAADAVRQTTSKMREFFMEDLTEIRVYNPVKEPKSLATILEDARSTTLETNGVRLGRWGAALSSRIPMTIDLNGRSVRGVFTPRKKYDPAGRLTVLFNNALKRVPKKNRQEAKRLFNSVLNPKEEYYETNPDLSADEEGTKKAHVLNFLYNVTDKDEHGYTYIDEEKLVEVLAEQSGTPQKDVRKILGTGAIDALLDTLDDGEITINARAGMPEGADITMRNVMMSRGAELFGVPEVIARSRPMKLNDGEKEIEGIFMEEAEGIDRQKVEKSSQYVSTAPLNGADKDAYRQVADLGVLDFIYGNIDRHRGNMLYKFENGKFAGVMGIDNDCSGGLIVPESWKNHLPPVGDMLFISDTMAEKILNTTPEQLAMTMHGIVEQKAIDAACERMKKIQDRIRETNKALQKDPTTFPEGGLLTAPKEFWGSGLYRRIINVFKKHKKSNIFTKAEKSAMEIAEVKNKSLRKSEKDYMESVGNNNRATRGGVYSQYIKATMILQQLQKVTKGKRTSPEFEAMRDAVKDYKEYTGSLVIRMKESVNKVKEGSTDPAVFQEQRISTMDFLTMQEKMKKIQETANHYKTNKLDKVGGFNKASDYEKKRIMVSGEVGKFADGLVDMKPDEEKQLRINARRSTEEFVRKTEPKKEEVPDAVQLQ